MSDDRIEQIKKRLEAATPGPWFYNGYSFVSSVDKPDIRDGLTFDEWSSKLDDDSGTGHSAERYGACPACGTDRPTGCEYAKEWTARDPAVASVPPSYGDTATGRHAADADFIAEAREDMPWLLARITELEAELAAAQATIAALTEDHADVSRRLVWNLERADTWTRQAEKAELEVVELQKAIKDAPHTYECEHKNDTWMPGDGPIEEGCTCWKADTSTAAYDRAIREAKTEALDETAEVIDERDEGAQWVKRWLTSRAQAIREGGE